MPWFNFSFLLLVPLHTMCLLLVNFGLFWWKNSCTRTSPPEPPAQAWAADVQSLRGRPRAEAGEGVGLSSALLGPLSKDMRSREATQKKVGALAAAAGLRLQGDRYPKLSAVRSALTGPQSFWNRLSSGPKCPPCQEQPHRCPHRGEQRLLSTQFYKGGVATYGSAH